VSATLPFISIVVPSFNQARYIRETLQSLLDQKYPALEVIIQDGGSTDGSIQIAEEYARNHPQTFQLFTEKDSGQADALNRGFARTKGSIMGFLNSDDTLYPSCLHQVAENINPGRGRYVVLGRCLFTGEGSTYVGVEHPSEYKSHFEHLAIWKRGHNTIPQPSVFWHRKVWERCGELNVSEHHVLDYDLFCRFSARYRFHTVDSLWSTYRMHAVSKSSQRSESEVLDLSIAVSRRYWGSWLMPLRWRCEVSHWLHNRHLHEHARHHARLAEQAARSQQPFTALIEFTKTLAYSPRMARDRLLYAWFAANRLKFITRLFLREDEGFTGRHGDGWIGPVFRADINITKVATKLTVHLKHIPQGRHQQVTCILKINRTEVTKKTVGAEEYFILEANVTSYREQYCQLELRCNSFFVPRDIHASPDDRRLSLQLIETKIETH
jgi:glycosyltransferase involved in cell wall biosynthesis